MSGRGKRKRVDENLQIDDEINLARQVYKFGNLVVKNVYRERCFNYNMCDFADLLQEAESSDDDETTFVFWSVIGPKIMQRINNQEKKSEDETVKEDEDEDEDDDWKYSGLTFKGDLQHGDVLDFDDYRATSTYIVLRTKHPSNGKEDFALVSTIGEYGYWVPPFFSDVPSAKFFYAAQGNLIQLLMDLQHTFPGSFLKKRFEVSTRLGFVERETNVSEDDYLIDYSVFDESFSISHPDEFGFTKDSLMYSIWVKYYNDRLEEMKIETLPRMTPLLVMVLKPLGLPNDVVKVIAYHVLW